MKIYLNIEADDPYELGLILAGLGQPGGVGQSSAPAGSTPPPAAGAAPPPEQPPAEEPKKTRGKGKAPTPDAAPPSSGASVGGEPASSSTAAATEPKAIDPAEVKEQMIDLLNDWTDAMPKDASAESTTVLDGKTIKVADIRAIVLGGMLAQLDAAKISQIDPSKFGLVPGLLDESRAKLAEFKAQRETEE